MEGTAAMKENQFQVLEPCWIQDSRAVAAEAWPAIGAVGGPVQGSAAIQRSGAIPLLPSSDGTYHMLVYS